MTIGFDVSDLCTNRADGTTRYTRELAKRLPGINASMNWEFIAPCAIETTTKNVVSVAAPFPKYWTQLRLPFTLQKKKLDVLFMPIQQLPYWRPKKIKYVAVVHDLAFHEYGPQFTYKDWLLLHLFTAQVVRHADRIIAVSHSTAADITRYYGRTEDVYVVHHGVNHDQFREYASDDEYVRSWEKLSASYPGLKRPYLLFVGQIQPRKNIVRLVEAFERLKIGRPELQLVVAGSHGWLQKPIVKRAQGSSYASSIFMPGRVPDDLLTALYWHAELFVLPSLYEGFGMPVLEAMGSGCPVVTSNVSSLPEITGDAAVLVDPLKVESIAEGIDQALFRREDLRQRGLVRAQDFSWDMAARKTLDILNS